MYHYDRGGGDITSLLIYSTICRLTDRVLSCISSHVDTKQNKNSRVYCASYHRTHRRISPQMLGL